MPHQRFQRFDLTCPSYFIHFKYNFRNIFIYHVAENWTWQTFSNCLLKSMKLILSYISPIEFKICYGIARYIGLSAVSSFDYPDKQVIYSSAGRVEIKAVKFLKSGFVGH